MKKIRIMSQDEKITIEGNKIDYVSNNIIISQNKIIVAITPKTSTVYFLKDETKA